MKKIFRDIIIITMAFMSVIAMYLILDKANMEGVTGTHINKVIINISKSFPELNISHFFTFIFIAYFYNKFYFDKEKIKKSIVVLSISFSVILVLGYSYHKTNSWELVIGGTIQLFKSIIKIIGYYFIIYILLKKFLDFLKMSANKEEKDLNKYLDFIFNKHPNISISVILLILWLPFIILWFPGVISWDGVTQIYQLLGRYQDFHINIINPEVALNNHHPILSTLIYGVFIEFGKLIGSVDIGIYSFILCQIALLIYTIIYSFKIMKKMNISNKLKLIALLFYGLTPIIYIHALNVLKDVIFGIFVFYYILILTDIIIDSQVLEKNSYIIKIIIVLFLTMMFRNNGLVTILLSYPILFFIIKKYRKKLILGLFVPLIIYMILNKVIYPILEISPGSIKEALSIPFQQTARTLSEGKEYDNQDLEKINKILDVETITKKYNPILSDAVKNTFNKNYTTEELLGYFQVWIKYLFKYPSTYIQATLNNSYGYLYPNKQDTVGWFRVREDFLNENPYNMKYLQTFQKERNTLEKIYLLEMKLPIVGTLLSPGFYNWMLIIFSIYILLSNNKKFIIINIALLTILLVCIASPYLSIRYMLAIVYSLPIMFATNIYSMREKNVKKGDVRNEK